MTKENTAAFADADRRTKLVSHLVWLIRRYRLDYSQFEAICKTARKATGLQVK